jgi:hypothetical protein
MTKYEVKFKEDILGHEDNSIKTLSELQELTMEIIGENEFTMAEGANWSLGFEAGAEVEDGQYDMVGFKEGLSDEAIWFLCSDVLSVAGMEVYQIHDGYKLLISDATTVPDSEMDSDVALRIDGIESGDSVLDMELYVDNKHIANYGSYSCGDQRVNIYKNEDDELTSSDDYEYDERVDCIEEYLEAKRLEKETGDEYVTCDMNCWFEAFYTTPEGDSLTIHSEQLQAECEYVHGMISEGMGIESDTVKEIVSVLETMKKVA